MHYPSKCPYKTHVGITIEQKFWLILSWRCFSDTSWDNHDVNLKKNESERGFNEDWTSSHIAPQLSNLHKLVRVGDTIVTNWNALVWD